MSADCGGPADLLGPSPDKQGHSERVLSEPADKPKPAPAPPGGFHPDEGTSGPRNAGAIERRQGCVGAFARARLDQVEHLPPAADADDARLRPALEQQALPGHSEDLAGRPGGRREPQAAGDRCAGAAVPLESDRRGDLSRGARRAVGDLRREGRKHPADPLVHPERRQRADALCRDRQGPAGGALRYPARSDRRSPDQVYRQDHHLAQEAGCGHGGHAGEGLRHRHSESSASAFTASVRRSGCPTAIRSPRSACRRRTSICRKDAARRSASWWFRQPKS